MTENLFEKVINLILQDKMVGLFQGESEWGPRALGNRSLLFNPLSDNLKYFNGVKNREWWRPLAGVVMLEHVHEYFDMLHLKESKWMSFAVQVKTDKIPCITTPINTCRIQTVTEEQNYNLYQLCKAMKEATGIPILGNTSLNLAGEVVAETREQAIDLLERSDIHSIFFPERMELVS